MELDWQWLSFEQLSGVQMHALLSLRQQVFVVEQCCAYQDADGFDRQSQHLLGYNMQHELIACARLTAPGSRFPEPSIGRVVVAESSRGQGVGRQLMQHCLGKGQQLYSAQTIRISAQIQLQAFYQSLGFVVCSEPYDEDGITHIDMQCQP